MKTISFTINQGVEKSFGSNRYEALPIQNELAELLSENDFLTLNFINVPRATQSWVDQVIGKFVLNEGADFLKRVKFQNCTPMVQSILKLVISDRLNDYEQMQISSVQNNHYPSSGLNLVG